MECIDVAVASSSEAPCPVRARQPDTAAQKSACSDFWVTNFCATRRSLSPSVTLLLLERFCCVLSLPVLPLLFMRTQRRMIQACLRTPCPPNRVLSRQLMHSPQSVAKQALQTLHAVQRFRLLSGTIPPPVPPRLGRTAPKGEEAPRSGEGGLFP